MTLLVEMVGVGEAGCPLPDRPACVRRALAGDGLTVKALPCVTAGQSTSSLSWKRLIDTSLGVAQICSGVRDSWTTWLRVHAS